ncbi:NF-kappa-B inhibitor alpha-like [Mercenaria mercenaria]|uniref:NF-kappa-B inhibitor alpha-like n=1 Tax=Mercenaria mercenaria TaxID=6596 RepID=UPI00234E68AF|nr:NF-kappa-B inhibitor alpha-like [Mercenaria mercenaria]
MELVDTFDNLHIGVDADKDGDTSLHVAIICYMNDYAMALIDIDEGWLNIQNCLLQTPLHLAVLTGQIDIVRALLTNGANATLRDHKGETPLHIACEKGDRDSVAALVRSIRTEAARKEYFSIRNCEGLTCVHVASKQREFIILGHLFCKGADVNIGDGKSGRTVLHYAVEKNDIEMVSLLLTHPNIEVDRKTYEGESPLYLAFWRNHRRIRNKLIKKGAYFDYGYFEEGVE